MSPWEQILRRAIGTTALTPVRLNRDALRLYQRVSVKLMKDTLKPDRPSGLILALEPGAGKTVSFLTAARDLLDEGLISKVLITGPLLVSETVWHEEIETWEHLKHTTYSICTGTEKQRIAALERDVEVYIINKENLPWLWEYLGRGARWDFDFVGIDEASMLKNGKKRTKLKKLTRFGVLAAARKHIKGVVELTGTPSPNGLVNLWGLAYIADQGARLGRTKSSFMERWFDFNKYTYEVKAKPYAEEQILSALGDIMFSLDPKDYAELPPIVENVIRVPLPPKVMDEYRRFKRTLVSEQYDVEAVNAAVLTNKLCQFANSSMFNEDGEEVWIHDCKLDALKNLHAEVGGTPLLVAYSFTFDKRRIQKEFPKAVVLNEVPDVMQTVRDWNAGKIDMLLAHRACLHPDTEVLTEYRGWVRIVEVFPWEKVFDGIEFVSHSGCEYAGIKEVTEVFGLTMTLDHRLLVGGQWVEAKDVGTDPCARRKARYTYTGNDPRLSALLSLQIGNGGCRTELPQLHLWDWAARNGLPVEKDHAEGEGTSGTRTHVYDLVDCGPRSRFVVRNADGEVFISHNSAGHGLNLQKGSNIFVSYGLTADLELWQQFNKRLHRPGQKADRVWHHIIVAKDTHDEDILPVLQDKKAVQDRVFEATRLILSDFDA